MSDLKKSTIDMASKNPRIAHLVLDRVVEAAGVRDFLPVLHSIFPKAPSGQHAYRILQTEVLPYLASENIWDGDFKYDITSTTEYMASYEAVLGRGYSRDPRDYYDVEVEVEVPEKLLLTADTPLKWSSIGRLITMEGGDLQALTLACEDRKFAAWLAGEIEQALTTYFKDAAEDIKEVLPDELEGEANPFGGVVTIKPGFYEPKLTPKRVEAKVTGRDIHMKVEVVIDLDYNDDKITVEKDDDYY